MAWIEVHDTLPDHPKILDLSGELRLDKDVIVGKLVRWWVWSLANREDGVFTKRDFPTIAEVMRFRGKPERLANALVKFKLLDQEGDAFIIHDWDEHVAMLLAKREATRAQTRQRVQKFRDKKRNGVTVTDGNGDVTRYGNECNAATVPNHISTTSTTARENAEASFSSGRENDTAGERADDDLPPEMRDGRIARIYDVFTKNVRMPTPIESEQLIGWLDSFDADVICFAIEQGALSGGRTYRMVESILERWKEIRVKDLIGAQAAQREWKNAQRKKGSQARSVDSFLSREYREHNAGASQVLEDDIDEIGGV